MDKKMFCYQCEQTVGCTGCTGNAGVCGKKAGTAKLQDELTGALIGLARAVDSAAAISKSTSQVIIEGLFTTVTNVSFDDAAIENMIQKVRAEKERLVPGCSKCQSPCGKSDEYDMQQLWNADEDIRSLKSLILFGIRGMAAYAYHANVLNYEDAEVNRFFCEALFKIGYEESMDTLLPTVLKVGEINLKCMALLDKANTKTYGTPEPTAVTLTVEKGPFIVVTGHDLLSRQRTSAHLHMSGSRDSQQALAAGQDQVDAERERVRALGKFVQNALRQLRGDHSFFGNTRASKAQHAPAAQADDL